jgi:diguanylate cyclase (GGDEF)-like protein
MFVHDATGSVYVMFEDKFDGAFPPGTLVDVHGTTNPGTAAPLIVDTQIEIIGRAPLPDNPPLEDLYHLETGSEDGKWVEVEGTIHSVVEHDHYVTLELAMMGGTVGVLMQREAIGDYSSLIDAKVSIRGNAAPLFNRNDQIVGARLMAPGLSAVRVLEPAPGDPFKQPVILIDNLLRWNQISTARHRVHVRGRVTLQWPGSSLCIRDATRAICAQSAQETHLALGDVADIVGFSEAENGTTVLMDTVFRSSGSSGPVAAKTVTAEQALLGKDDSELVQIDGQVISSDLASSGYTILLNSGNIFFTAMLPKSLAAANAGALNVGSKLRVTGICSVQLDIQSNAVGRGIAVAKSFQILMRSPSDVTVLQSPPWWTPGHALLVLAVALAVTLAVLVWVVALRRRVEHQTTVIRESEERYRHLAQHDALTGLPTRVLLHDRLQSALVSAARHQTGLALLMLDLDNFKHINDSLGHHAGDQTLCTMADRICRNVRKTDTVARMGGDEFVVLLPEVHDLKEAERIAGKIVAALSVPMKIGNRTVPVTVSVGVCSAFGSGLDADELLASVDAAMYQAKAQGRNRFHVFTAEMAREKVEKFRMQAGLGHAIERNELELHYQPMVSLETGAFTGVEALLRWRSKEMGMIMPGDFIPLAEESGLIVPIGEWVLREACREIGLLERQLNCSLMLAVNLSPRQFQQDDMPKMIQRALADFGRSPNAVEFEITERMLMSDSRQTMNALIQLRDLGVNLAIDDFGIGFSSLSYITRFSVDRIKIDRSFVENCTSDENSVAVVRAIVAMAHGLGIQVVAEGIETPEQLDLLRRERCDTAQGYYFSRPVPSAKLPALLRPTEKIAILDLDEAVPVQS